MAEKLVGGCISKKIWDQMCANTLDLENATVEEIKAGLDPDFVPEGWLDSPTPPEKKLKLSLAKKKKTECTSELSASKLAGLLLQFPRRKSTMAVCTTWILPCCMPYCDLEAKRQC